MFSLICALNKRLSKQSWGWWFETPSSSLWHHCNACWRWARGPISPWGWNKTAAFPQTFSNAFSLMEMYAFSIKISFQFVPKGPIKLTLFQYWFRQWLGPGQVTSHCLNQWCIWTRVKGIYRENKMMVNNMKSLKTGLFYSDFDKTLLITGIFSFSGENSMVLPTFHQHGDVGNYVSFDQ